MNAIDRRSFLTVCSSLGLSSTIFADTLWGFMQAPTQPPKQKPEQKPLPPGTTPAGTIEGKGESSAQSASQESAEAATSFQLTPEMIRAAAGVAGLHFNDDNVQMMVKDLNERLGAFRQIWALHIPNEVAPALIFDPVFPDMKLPLERRPMRLSRVAAVETPKNIEDLAFLTVRQLGELLRTKRISATNLTEMYLHRLERYNPVLHFMVTPTTDRAMAQAKEADRAIAAGKYRGPLHGIPWGAKDLLAVKGYPTTWGAAGFEKQTIDEDATVVKRLDEAGAILIAKLTLGALAQGDVWFGAVTRNPWKVTQGSSGSSAGPGSATAAGCVGFAIGSETLGSISSPSTRNGVTGLRPTFGFVPRTGAMALSWSMDKLGPMCRAVEDCAVVLSAIHGPDGQDRCVRPAAFNWDCTLDIKRLRIGYLKADFEREPSREQLERERPEQRTARLEQRKADQQSLDVIQNKLGIKLIEVELPKLPAQAMRPILVAEAAAAFDELTRSGRDRVLTAQTPNDWPNTFREARFIPAVEYINANRARTMLMQQMEELFKTVDVIVSPTFGPQLLVTNLTGHPAVILPNGFRESDNTPTSITVFGNLYYDAQVLAVAKAYQDATNFHLKHPQIPTGPTEPFPPDVKLK